jgi:hypothetical protein
MHLPRLQPSTSQGCYHLSLFLVIYAAQDIDETEAFLLFFRWGMSSAGLELEIVHNCRSECYLPTHLPCMHEEANFALVLFSVILVA